MQSFESGKKKGHEETTQKPKEITIGSEVRTRAIPIYAHGSIGINFVAGIPLVSEYTARIVFTRLYVALRSAYSWNRRGR